MRDINQLCCPTCKEQFASLTIKEGAVVCPACGAVVFSYRGRSKGQLYAEVDGSRQHFVRELRPWLHPERYAAAPILLGYLVSHIADTLPE